MTRLDDPRTRRGGVRRRARGYAGGRAPTRAVRPRGADARVRLRRGGCRGCARSACSRLAADGGVGGSGSARETAAEVVAVDLSPRMVELARERGVDAQVADVQAAAVRGWEFDLVVAAWMLYHVPDLDPRLAEIARVLAGRRPLRRCDQLAADHLDRDASSWSGATPSNLSFNRRERGGVARVRTSTTVQQLDIDGELEFAGRDEVAEYVGVSIAMSPFIANLPAEMSRAVRRAAARTRSSSRRDDSCRPS